MQHISSPSVHESADKLFELRKKETLFDTLICLISNSRACVVFLASS